MTPEISPATDKPWQFQRGNQLGHRGRPKQPPSLRAAFREMSPRLVEELRNIALGAKSRPAEKLKAIELALAYAWGRPPQHLEVQVDANIASIDASMTPERAALLYQQTIAAGHAVTAAVVLAQGAPLIDAEPST